MVRSTPSSKKQYTRNRVQTIDLHCGTSFFIKFSFKPKRWWWWYFDHFYLNDEFGSATPLNKFLIPRIPQHERLFRRRPGHEMHVITCYLSYIIRVFTTLNLTGNHVFVASRESKLTLALWLHCTYSHHRSASKKSSKNDGMDILRKMAKQSEKSRRIKVWSCRECVNKLECVS